MRPICVPSNDFHFQLGSEPIPVPFRGISLKETKYNTRTHLDAESWHLKLRTWPVKPEAHRYTAFETNRILISVQNSLKGTRTEHGYWSGYACLPLVSGLGFVLQASSDGRV